MPNLIKIKQKTNRGDRDIIVNADQILFFYDGRIVFNNSAISVRETKDEITEKINELKKC